MFSLSRLDEIAKFVMVGLIGKFDSVYDVDHVWIVKHAYYLALEMERRREELRKSGDYLD